MTGTNQPTLQSPAKPDLRSLLTALGLESRKQVNCARIGIIQSFNPANQTVTVQVADTDVDASYRALTEADTAEAVTCASGSSITFTTIGPFVRGHFGTAPTTGTLAISR